MAAESSFFHSHLQHPVEPRKTQRVAAAPLLWSGVAQHVAVMHHPGSLFGQPEPGGLHHVRCLAEILWVDSAVVAPDAIRIPKAVAVAGPGRVGRQRGAVDAEQLEWTATMGTLKFQRQELLAILYHNHNDATYWMASAPKSPHRKISEKARRGERRGNIDGFQLTKLCVLVIPVPRAVLAVEQKAVVGAGCRANRQTRQAAGQRRHHSPVFHRGQVLDRGRQGLEGGRDREQSSNGISRVDALLAAQGTQ